MRKILKWIGIPVAAIVVILILASLYLYWNLKKEKIESLLEESLSRKVYIGELNWNLFSAIGGFEAENIQISNRMSPEKRTGLRFPIPQKNLFLKAEKCRFKFAALRLLSRQFIIKKLFFEKPAVSFIRYGEDQYNISDLMEDDDNSFFKRIAIESLIIQSGRIFLSDIPSGNQFEIYNVVYQSNRKNQNHSSFLHLARATCGIRSQKLGNFSFARDLDFLVESSGSLSNVFDTGSFQPSFKIHVHTPTGRIVGLKIFQKMKDLPVIQDYLDGLSLLGQEIGWKEGDLEIQYDKSIINFSDGEMKARGYSIKYNGSYNVATGNLDVTARMAFPKSLAEKFKTRLQTNLEDILPRRLAKNETVNQLTRYLMAPLVNDKGQIHLVYGITGKPDHPVVVLIEPSIDTLSASLARFLRDRAVQKGHDLLDKILSKQIDRSHN